MLLTASDDVDRWVEDSFGVDAEVVRRIARWAGEREMPYWVTGDALLVMLPSLRASAGWLTVSAVARSVVLSFDRLNGYAPFQGPTRNRLLKKMQLGGFLDKRSDPSHGRVRLEALSDDLEWTTLKWRLDLVADIASTWASAQAHR